MAEFATKSTKIAQQRLIELGQRIFKRHKCGQPDF